MVSKFLAHVRGQFVGYLALFVALGGTAVGAGYVISKNKQLGPRTVSGNHAPKGKHDNIVNRSITAADIQPNSIGGGRIAESTLDRVPSSARAFDAERVGGHPAPTFFAETFDNGGGGDLIANTEGFSARASCEAHANTFTVTFEDRSGSTRAPSLNWFYGNGSSVKAWGGLFAPAGASRTVDITESRIEGQFIYRAYADSASGDKDNVAFIAFHGYASGGDGFCELHGAVYGSKNPFE